MSSNPVEAETRRGPRAKHQAVAALAHTDPLTGLLSRVRFQSSLLAHPAADGGEPISSRGRTALLLFDVDDLAGLNHACGYRHGDLMLQRLAAVVREHLDERDVACRWDGDEILILRPETTAAEAVFLYEQVKGELANLDRTMKLPWSRTLSAGLTLCAGEELNGGAIAQATQAMRMAKRLGRDRLCTYGMVRFEQAIQQLGQPLPGDAEAALERILDQFSAGPIQREHLTEHSRRVSDLAVSVGRSMNLEPERIERLRTAGLFHDLGKLMVPEEVLAKPGPLTTPERVLMDRHAEDGATMARQLGLDPAVSECIRRHHGRADDAAGADLIPLESRIMSVADAWDAMCSHRSYKRARSTEAALAELQQQAGKQFDAEVVAAALRCCKRADETKA